LFQSTFLSGESLGERLRSGLGRRATGLLAALLIEALLVLLLLTLGQAGSQDQKQAGEVLSTFDAAPSEEESEAPPESKPEESPTPDRSPPAPQEQPEPTPQPPHPQPQPQPPQPQPAPAPSATIPPALIPMSKDQMAGADISKQPQAGPSAQAKPMMGPPNTGTPGDTPRVGTAPNGQPLYAAAWYRKPYDNELAGYLSTAQGPGWGLIACKTAPDFRVEDCVALDEYPDGSNISRAVLAAAWQFKVRPPQVGGRSVIGAWVRIRIDYGLKKG